MRRSRKFMSFERNCIAAIALSAVAGGANAASPAQQSTLHIPNEFQQVDFDLHNTGRFFENQGYTIKSVEVTFLGRMRFILENELVTREVIVSRTTGAILRDVVLANSTGTPNSNGPAGAQAGQLAPLQQGGNNVAGQVTGTVNETVNQSVGTVTNALGL